MDVGSGKRKRNRPIESEMDSASDRGSGVDRGTEDHRDQRLREFQKQKSREREREIGNIGCLSGSGSGPGSGSASGCGVGVGERGLRWIFGERERGLGFVSGCANG